MFSAPPGGTGPAARLGENKRYEQGFRSDWEAVDNEKRRPERICKRFAKSKSCSEDLIKKDSNVVYSTTPLITRERLSVSITLTATFVGHFFIFQYERILPRCPTTSDYVP